MSPIFVQQAAPSVDEEFRRQDASWRSDMEVKWLHQDLIRENIIVYGQKRNVIIPVTTQRYKSVLIEPSHLHTLLRGWSRLTTTRSIAGMTVSLHGWF